MLGKLFTLCLLALSTVSLEHTNDTLGFIIGGESVKDKSSFGFMAAIDYNNKFICGGTVIHPSWILTAAHCVVQPSLSVNMSAEGQPILPPNTLRIRIGSLEPERGGNVYQVTRIIAHPEFTDTSRDRTHDIALLQLTTPVPNAKMVRVLQQRPPSDVEFTAVGWGIDNPQQIKAADQLKFLTLRQVSDTTKNTGMVLAGQNPSDDYIAAGGETGHDTCQGDSGGPLLYYDKNSKQYVQSGITSFGSNTQGLNAISNASTITCARRGDVGFYYRADMELDWIQSMTLIPMEQWSIKGLWQDTPSAGSKMAVRSSGASTLNHFLVNWLR